MEERGALAPSAAVPGRSRRREAISRAPQVIHRMRRSAGVGGGGVVIGVHPLVYICFPDTPSEPEALRQGVRTTLTGEGCFFPLDLSIPQVLEWFVPIHHLKRVPDHGGPSSWRAWDSGIPNKCLLSPASILSAPFPEATRAAQDETAQPTNPRSL